MLIYAPNLSVMSVQILINSDCVFVPHKIMIHINCTHSDDSPIKSIFILIIFNVMILINYGSLTINFLR